MARPREFSEDDVLAAAREQFLTGGYAGTSVDALTTATGLSRSSLYGAFGDKHDLFLQTLDEYRHAKTAEMRGELRGPNGTAYARLGAHVRRFVADIAADVERKGCLMAKSAAELAASDPDVAEKVSEMLHSMRDELRASVVDAQAEGSLDADADPGQLANMLLAVLRGLLALGKGGMEPEAITGAAAQALALLPGRASGVITNHG